MLAAVLVRVPTLDQPLLERQPFRQTQTAYTALRFYERGIDLLHPELPVLGPPGEVPFEFPLFQAAASVPMAYGVKPDVAVRSTSLAFFVLTALLLWGLVRDLAGRAAGLLAFGVFLFSPFAMLWGRTAMIEYLVTAAAVAYLWGGLRWQRGRRPLPLVAAIAAGVVAMAVKPTSVVFLMLPLLAYRPDGTPAEWRAWVRSRFDPGLIALVVVPLLVAVAWTQHADSIKAANATTRFLTSEGLQEWNFGTLGQRLRIGDWARAFAPTLLLVAGPPVWLACLHRRLRPPDRPGFWLAMLGAAALPVAVFFNLYVAHDYYSIAVSPIVAALFGVGTVRLARVVSPEAQRRILKGAVAWIIVLLAVAAPYWWPAYQRRPERSVRPLALAAELARTSTRRDRIVIQGLDWSPAVPYYARREVLMLPAALLRPSVMDALPVQGYDLLLAAEIDFVTAYLAARWPWVGSVGPHVLRLAHSPSELRGAAVMGGAAVPPNDAPARPAVTAPCDGRPVAIPVDPGPAWLRLIATRYPRSIGVQGAPGPLPFLSTVVVRSPGPTVTVSCSDGGPITVTAYAGPAA